MRKYLYCLLTVGLASCNEAVEEKMKDKNDPKTRRFRNERIGLDRGNIMAFHRRIL